MTIGGLCPHRAKILKGAEQLGQIRFPHQPFVHRAGTLAAFADDPDDEGLAAAHIPGGEDAGNKGVG